MGWLRGRARLWAHIEMPSVIADSASCKILKIILSNSLVLQMVKLSPEGKRGDFSKGHKFQVGTEPEGSLGVLSWSVLSSEVCQCLIGLDSCAQMSRLLSAFF